MSDDQQQRSYKPSFPAPPRMTPISASASASSPGGAAAVGVSGSVGTSGSSKTLSSGSLSLPLPPPPPPPRQPHSSTAPIPMLSSAPPSANLTYEQQQQLLLSQPFPLQRTSGAGLQLPPPPPPPPSSMFPPPPATTATLVSSFPAPPTRSVLTSSSSKAAATATTTSSTSTTIAAVTPPPPPPPLQPTIAPLPPPPIFKKTSIPQQNPITTTTTTFPEQPPPHSQPAVDDEPLMPPKLPPTTFTSTKPNQTMLLAKRQTHIPILVLATEHAHKMAWKNKLRLVDLLEGLVQQQQSSITNDNTSNTATSSNTSSSSSVGMPFRSATKSLQIQLHDLQVTFVEPEDLFLPTQDQQAQAMLDEYANLQPQDGNLEQELAHLEDQVDNLLQEHNSNTDNSSDSKCWDFQERQGVLEQVVKDAYALTSPTNIPWLWRFRTALDSTTNNLPHDLVQAPPVVLMVATTQEELSVMETLQDLVNNTHYLPAPYFNGLLDSTALRRHVWVLHDVVDGPPDSMWNESALRQSLSSTFGNNNSNTALIRINSLSLETARQLSLEESSDLWQGGGQCGACLSVSDRVSLRKHLSALLTYTLLPAMERRIADLNAIVHERKRGVKNVFKSLWGASSTTTTSTTGGTTTNKDNDTSMGATAGTGGGGELQQQLQPAKYRHDSIESQARLLADSLFLMKDYDTALSIYKLIKDDFKNNKEHLHYGGVQEMMALCMYLTDPYGRSKDIFSSLENALLSYSRAAEERGPTWGEKPGRPRLAPAATRLATRLCLVLLSTRNICQERHLEVADLLASASSHETALGSAVLLEQSSAHYFQADMFRKYSFHMLMAGHQFRSAEQHHHAFRCFTSALYIYRDSKWEELHNHLRSALAAQLYSMGRMAVSLQLYAKLVGTTKGGRVSSKSQQKFVNHLLEICNEHPKKALVGADRMAASSKLTGAQRDAVRRERLERIVQVVRYTKSASRVLELPNIDLPFVDDASVAVVVDETSAAHHEYIPSFGDAQRGSDQVWEELELMATAELKANDKSKKMKKSQSYEDVAAATVALGRIEDVMVRQVIEQVDKEMSHRNMKERSKKLANYKETPPVRAQMEPLEVEFAVSNPLAIPIDLVDMQIVARMSDETGNQVCTNEDAIKITPLASYDQKEGWTFHGSTVKFLVPDFCRVSSGGVPSGSINKDPLKQPWKSAEEVQPFFVVTKLSLTLEPESRRTVSASICPLARGNLEIVGVRCRLLDDVWVYHPFDLKGPLLQNTRSNRANRVRAEPIILKAKVERGMPCLVSKLIRTSSSSSNKDAAVVEDGGPCLQGQISSWILRLSNVGTAGATNVFLKTSVPWVNVIDGDITSSSSEEGLDSEPLHCCIGPTGTLLQLPVRGPGLQAQGVIQPGEAVDIPIRIRASVYGRHEFYMLFRYELVVDDDSNAEAPTSTPRFRWLRKMFDVPVYPAISLSASVMPSFSNHSEHVLSLELTNNRTERPDKLELIIDKLSLASRCYGLQPLPGQFSGRDGAKLGWQERITAHYRIVALNNEGTPCVLSECALTPANDNIETHDAASSCLLNFLCLERAHEAFEETLKWHRMALARAAAAQGQDSQHPRSIAQIRRANTSALSSSSQIESEVGHPTSVARLCPPASSEESICLVCSWRSEDNKLVGEHYIRDLPIRPPTRAPGCPLTITAKHPQIVSTDFSNGPADVPIEITLRNRLVREPVEFVVTIERPETFDFIGPECFKSALSGGEELSVPLRALIPSTGVYNLQKLRLTIDDDEQISYIFPMQWTVTVNENRD